MRILLGGGTGFLGRHLEKQLLNRGHTIQLISRTPGNNRITWDELESEASSTNGLPECDAVVNLSGENILNPFRRWNASYKNDIYNSRIGTNELLVKLMSEVTKKPRTWISAHAEGIYPRSTTIEYDESFTPEQRTGSYSQQLCYDWERSALLPNDLRENIRHVGIRIGLVLGRDGGFIQNAWWPFSFGLGGTIGSGTQVFPWVHVNDCTNLFVHAIENENVNGFLNAVSPGACTTTEFTKAFGKALNRPTIFAIPEFVIKFATGPDRSPLLLEGSKIKPTKAIESGFTFEFTNIEKAMDDIVNS